MVIKKFSDKRENYQLGYYYPTEHGERIDGGVAHSGIVAGHYIVGIVESHGIGHASAQHTTRETEVHAT